MVPASYHAFFGACASVAGALIGLVFVAISVTPHKLDRGRAPTSFQIRAGLAFATLVNALVVALLALLPGHNLGIGGIILAVGGLSSMAGLTVLSVRDKQTRRRPWSFVRLVVPTILFVLQLIDALQLLAHPDRSGPVSSQAILLVVFFAVSIDRAWELVGGTGSGLVDVLGGLAADRRSSHKEPTGEADA